MAKPNKAAGKDKAPTPDETPEGVVTLSESPLDTPPEESALNTVLSNESPDTPPDAPPEAPAVELGPRPIRKINPKDVMEKKMKEITIPKGGETDLFTIIGTAFNLRDGESSFGPWTSLVGEFEATRLLDGQRFISTQCFVPGAAGDLLVTQVRKFVTEEVPVTPEQFKKTGKTYKVTGETVEMALVVSIKEASRDGGANYEYVIRPIVPVQKMDPLAALRERVMKTLPLLGKPLPGAAIPALKAPDAA